MYGFIYLTTNMINNKKYVGMCKNTHSKGYIGSGKILKASIKKYGKENFNREILEECISFDDMCAAEHRWISKLNAVKSEEYYNLYEGGYGGCSKSMKEYWSMFTKEERKILRKWNKPDMTGKNNPMYGKKHSETTKAKIGKKSVNRNWGRKTPINGANNPKAIPIIVIFDDGSEVTYDCIKNFSIETGYCYSSIKSIYKNGNYSKKYRIRIKNA